MKMAGQSLGISRNNRRVKLTIPDDLMRHARKIAKAHGVPLAKYLASLIIDTITDEDAFLEQERKRLASALIAVDAKTKMRRLKKPDWLQKVRSMLE